VVVGNPNTSIDALVSVLRHPDLLTSGVVQRLILFQPAFGAPALDPIAGVARRLHLSFLSKHTTAGTRGAVDQALASFPDALRPLLDRTVGYVRAGADDAHKTLMFRLMGKLLPHGENDGVSYTAEQQLAGVGHDLAVDHTVDHWGFVMSAPFARAPADVRQRALGQLLWDR
jgi:hypothetical protein